eukprot:tig00021365_g20816.t1
MMLVAVEQKALSGELEATGIAGVLDARGFLDWLAGPLLDFAFRYPDGMLGRHNRIIGAILVLQDRRANESCRGQPRFQKLYPECFTGPSIFEPAPPLLRLDYTDPANGETLLRVMKIVRTMFGLPGTGLDLGGASGASRTSAGEPARRQHRRLQEAAAAEGGADIAGNGTASAAGAAAAAAAESDGEGSAETGGAAPEEAGSGSPLAGLTKAELELGGFLVSVYENVTRAGHGIFPGGEIAGFISVFNVSRETAFAQVEFLRMMDIVGRSTRSISVKFATYNGHVRMMALTEVMLSLPLGGSPEPHISVDVFRVELYSTSLDMFRLALEIFVIVCVLVRLVDTGMHLLRARRKRRFLRTLAAGMFLADLLDQLLFVAVIAFWGVIISNQSGLPAPRPDLLDSYDVAEDVNLLGRLYDSCLRAASLFRTYHVLTAINLFLGLIRIFKLLHFQGRMGLLTRTLVRSSSDLFHLAALVLIVLIVRVPRVS